MKIHADKNGMNAVKDLCDVALRTGGLKNYQIITEILNSLKELKEPLKNKEEDH